MIDIERIKPYFNIGWKLIPVKYKDKKPLIPRWNEIEHEYTLEDFKNKEINIGLLTGNGSNIVDIDLDDDIARRLAVFLLPPTGAVFGRKSSPYSHWLYKCRDAKNYKFAIKNKMYAEIRATGLQTVIPPSIHPSGEEIKWIDIEKKKFITDVYTPDPSEITEEELLRAVKLLIIGSIMVENWENGVRQELTMAITGLLVKSGFTYEEIENFIFAVCSVSKDNEFEKRKYLAKQTYEKYKRGEPVAGWTKLSQYLAKDQVQKIRELLGTIEEELQRIDVNIKAILEADYPEPDWLIEGVMPEGGTILIAGRPKVGKSWLGLNLAVSLAEQKEIMGLPAPKEHRVLYLALEDIPRRIKERIEILNIPIEKDNLFIITADRFTKEYTKSLHWLEGLIVEEKFDVVIVDTLGKLRTGMSRDQQHDIYGFDYNSLNNFKSIADRLGVTFVLIHHTRKTESTDPVDEVLGSTGITGSVDTICILKKERNDNSGSLFITGRDGIEKDIRLWFNNGKWELAESTDAEQFKTQKDFILHVIYDIIVNGDNATLRKISEVSGKSMDSVRTAIRRLKKDGFIIHEKGTLGYMVTDKGIERLDGLEEKTGPQETTTETTSFPDTFFTQDYVATIMTTNETVDVPSDTEVEEEMTTDDHPLDHSVDHQNYPGGVLDIGLDNNVTTNETIVVPTDTEDNDEVTTPDHQDDHQLDHLDNYSGSPKNDVTTNETTSETQGVSTDIWVSGIMTTSDHWFDHFDHQEDLKEKEKERTKEKEKEKNILNNNIILNYLSSEIVDLNLNNIFNNINNLKEKEKKEIYKERKEKEIQTPGDTDSISYSVSLDPYLNNNLDLNNNNNLELNYKQQSSVNNQDFIVSGVGYNLYAPTPTPTPTPEKEKKEKERKEKEG